MERRPPRGVGYAVHCAPRRKALRRNGFNDFGIEFSSFALARCGARKWFLNQPLALPLAHEWSVRHVCAVLRFNHSIHRGAGRTCSIHDGC